MSIVNQLSTEELDADWVELILNARHLGLGSDEIRAFLKNPCHPAHMPIENESSIEPSLR